MSPHLLPAIPLFAEHAPGRGKPLSHVAAYAWWALKTHVAEAHGLPRDAAGPEPRPTGRLSL